ncbi:GntR family transcriptional regulator [Telmatospirillum siberiense]|uniref:GntR family transcriptional regulator n=1 Tax=Telmatospirillum siberiense TaxID=382514 RepID=A0A2N3PZ32_9PROT|nr:GntR family transcriptional regulator [Telmatospirillum siberiense]PKU25621.1 GntR family transcriptional regulator [Telmatospirillum siberiense]
MAPTMPLENRHRRLSEQALDAVRRQIVTGVYPPDTRLSEVELSEKLGVSRTPVREALIRLAEEGLVKIVPQIGSFVAPISLDAVRQAQFIREHLECALIAEAAKHIDIGVNRQMSDNLKQQAIAAQKGDWDSFYSYDEALHAIWATASGNSGVWRVIQQSKVHLDRVRQISDRRPEHMALLLKQHTTIANAVAKGDVATAQTELRNHLRLVFVTMRKLDIARNAATADQPD